VTPELRALVTYSAQLFVVVGVATLAASLFRLTLPAARLAYWRAVGVICLALPLLAFQIDSPQAISVEFGRPTLVGPAGEPAVPLLAKADVTVAWIWVAGVMVSLAGLAGGALRLRRFRRESAPAAVDAGIDALRAALAPHAEFRWSSDLRQPATFGLRRPVILLPRSFEQLDTEARHAVACHELLHVARHDWFWVVVEAHVRAIFWFHPAAWWVVERMQLAREQLIDQLVVTRTTAKKAYMQALLTFADEGRSTALSIAFIRRRHLRSRFQSLVEERHMSIRRLTCMAALLAMVMIGTTVVVGRALPLDLVALAQQNTGARLEIRLAETAPGAGLVAASAPGPGPQIYLHQAVLVGDGDVASASVVAGPGGASSVAVTFNPTAAARLSKATAGHIGRPLAIVLNGTVRSVLTVRAPIGGSAVISGPFTADVATDLASSLSHVEPLQGARPTGVTLPAPLVEAKPFYNAAAMQAGIEGTVLLETIVLADGSVGDVKVVRSLDTTYGLDQAAIDAMKQWRFRPATKDGNPLRVAVAVEMTFTLK
jgi:TonB family protein